MKGLYSENNKIWKGEKQQRWAWHLGYFSARSYCHYMSSSCDRQLKIFTKWLNKNPTKKWEKDLKIHFSKEDPQMTNKHKQRCSGQCKSKSWRDTTSHSLGWLLFKNLNKCGETGNLVHWWWECKNGTSTVKKSFPVT